MNAPRGRLGSYAAWQLRDYVMGPGVGVVLIALVVVVPMFIGKQSAVRNGLSTADMERAFTMAYDQVVAMLMVLGPILGTAGIASADRSPGLTRFLFSKPVSVTGYYLQAWAVRGTALLVFTGIVAMAVNHYIVKVSVPASVASVAVAWVLAGGASLLLSVLIARDTAMTFVVYLVPNLLSGILDAGTKWWWLKPTLTVLPPTHRLDEFRKATLAGQESAPGDLWHIVLFGAGCVVLAAYLVRRLPLVR